MPVVDPSDSAPSHVIPLPVAQLRDLLRQKYPDAHRRPPVQETAPASSAWEILRADALTLSTLEGRFTEITGAGEETMAACPGLGLILHHLLEAASGRGAVLVDGRDRFDPLSYPAALCQNLFWARCRNLETALKVTDLFLRDANLPLVILDLFHDPGRELTQVPRSVWYRFRQMTEQSGCGLCLLATRPTSPAAHRRLALVSSFSIEALDLPRAALLPQLRLRLERDAFPARRIA